MTTIDVMREQFAELREASARSLEDPRMPISAAAIAQFMGGQPTRAGVSVTAESAMRSTAVYASTDLISSTVATLPLIVYRRLRSGGKERATDHPLYALLHDEPNPDSTSAACRTRMEMGHLLRGNGYALLQRNGRGDVLSLTDLHPGRVEPMRTLKGEKVYLITLPDGTRETVAQDDIAHVMGMSWDGLRGLSVIQLARLAVGLSIAAEEFGADLFGNSSRPSGILKTPKGLSKEETDRLATTWAAACSNDKRLGTVVLEEDATWQSITMSPQDSQFLDTRKFQIAEIARMFRLDPAMIGGGGGDSQTYANVENRLLMYEKHCIRPRCVVYEQEFNRKCFRPSERGEYFVEHSMEGLLRGDSMTRARFYNLGISGRWMTPNEARERENLNPLDGGDEFPAGTVSTGDPQPTQTQGAKQ